MFSFPCSCSCWVHTVIVRRCLQYQQQAALNDFQEIIYNFSYTFYLLLLFVGIMLYTRTFLRIVFSLFPHINSESFGEKLHDLCIVAEWDWIYTFHLENDNRFSLSFFSQLPSLSFSLSLCPRLVNYGIQSRIRTSKAVVAKLFLNDQKRTTRQPCRRDRDRESKKKKMCTDSIRMTKALCLEYKGKKTEDKRR